MSILEKAVLTSDIEGRYYSPKMQWWCAHAEFTSDDGQETSLYFWPALGSLDEAWICSLHQGDDVIDLTQLHLSEGSISASRDGVDVHFGDQYIRGHYPSYEIRVGGDTNRGPVEVHLTMEAQVSAFEALPKLRGITWHYVPKLRVTGTMLVNGRTSEVSGTGYLERRRGRFWSPGISRGLWESIPMPSGSADSFSIPLFYKVWRGDGSIQLQTLTFTLDGETMIDFEDVEVDILETTRFEGFEEIEHPIRYRLRASGDGGEAEIEVVRSPRRLAMRDYFNDPDPRAKVAGFYGIGRSEGRIIYQGVEQVVEGRSFGSALFFSTRGD